MVISCVVVGCTSRFQPGSGLKFHRIPTNNDKRTLWLNAIRRKNWTPTHSGDRVCGLHFISGTASNDPDNPDFIPSLHLGYCTSSSISTPTHKADRYNRAHSRKRGIDERAEAETAASILLDLSNSSVLESQVTDTDKENVEDAELQKATDFDLHDSCLKKITALKKENTALIQQNYELKFKLEEMEAKVNSAKFGSRLLEGENRDAKTLFFTGVPSYSVFMWLVQFCASVLPASKVLSKSDILLATLMKLRLNLVDTDLAFRFGVSRQHISDTLSNTFAPLAEKLSFLIYWPEKEDVIRHMPAVIKNSYRRCRVIIDCCEIFIERPGNLTARAMTWSNYKSHNTIKILVAISPVGAVTFVSRAFGGRVSDKVITQRSGFLQLLEYGDLVLADRGFLIADDLSACGAQLAIPSFTKGKSQLSAKEVETSRQLSRVRIHVERAIERLKNFKVLCTTMKMNLVPNADNIITICGAISNLHPKLVG